MFNTPLFAFTLLFSVASLSVTDAVIADKADDQTAEVNKTDVAVTPIQTIDTVDDPQKDDQTDATDQTGATELTVAPLDHLQYPSDRPKWIDSTGSNDRFALDVRPFDLAVTSGPVDSVESAEEMMMMMARGEVANYLQARLNAMDANVPADDLNIDSRWIADQLIKRQYQGELSVGGEPAFEHAALLSFGQEQLDYLEASVRNYQLRHRLVAVGVFASLGLAGLLGSSILLGGLANRQRRKQVA